MERSVFVISLILCLVISGNCDHHHRAVKRSSSSSSPTSRQNSAELKTDFWLNQAQATLKSKLGQQYSKEAKPKNIIFFIGDGMNIQTSSAARVHAGGDENYNLSFDKFPYFGLSRTYCTNRQVPDSASTATAYLTGVKTNYGLVGVDSNVRRYNCSDHANTDYHTTSIAEWAMEVGKAAGFVTTTPVTHASPSPLYAHSANRYWETDWDMIDQGCDADQLEDITEQLVYGATGQKLKVVLGGGRSRFRTNETIDEEGDPGLRTDGKDLIEEWKEIHKEMGQSEYIWNREQLMNVDPMKTDYLLGLFAEEYMKYDYLAKEDPLEPHLSDMVEIAIKMLQKEEKGYFLFVEGGKIDNAHHSTYAKTAMDETRAFSEAIELAQRLTNSHDTLIVVSADHGHVMTYNGYPDRGNDITGIGGISDHDDLPYTTLSYINGKGNDNMYGSVFGERADVSEHDLGAYDHRYYGHFRLNSETHSGDDVGIYATGPQSHIFVGEYEQNALPYLMAYATDIGPYKKSSAVKVTLGSSSIVGLLVIQMIFKTLLED